MSTPTAPSAAPSPSAGSASTPSPATAPANSAPTPASSSTPPSSSSTPTQKTGGPGGKPADIAADAVGKATGSEQTTAQQAQIADQIKQEEIRKHKLKVNGREVEMEEREVLRRAQLAEAADEKFREAAQIRKETEQFFNQLFENPLEVLTHPDLAERINFREIAEKYLAGELQKEMLSPEQRELMELRSFKEAQEAQRQAAEQKNRERAQQAQMAQLQARAAQEYDTKITEVLKQSNLPKTPEAIKRIAGLMHDALSKGYELDVPTAVDMVRQGYTTDLQALVSGMDGEPLIKFLGDELVKKIRRHDLAALRKQLEPESAGVAPTQTAPHAPRPQPKAERTEKMRTDDWLAKLREKAGV